MPLQSNAVPPLLNGISPASYVCWPLFLIYIKVKCTLVQALRLCTGRTAHRGSRGIALPFHDHGTRRGWGISVTPGRFLPPRKTRCSLYRRLGGHQVRSGQMRKISPPPGFDPRTVQPVASRYTDWATRPTNFKKFHFFFRLPISYYKTFPGFNVRSYSPVCLKSDTYSTNILLNIQYIFSIMFLLQ